MAFMLGIPISGIMASKLGLHVPLLVAASICVVNVLYISVFVPESLPPARRKAVRASPLHILCPFTSENEVLIYPIGFGRRRVSRMPMPWVPSSSSRATPS